MSQVHNQAAAGHTSDVTDTSLLADFLETAATAASDHYEGASWSPLEKVAFASGIDAMRRETAAAIGEDTRPGVVADILTSAAERALADVRPHWEGIEKMSFRSGVTAMRDESWRLPRVLRDANASTHSDRQENP